MMGAPEDEEESEDMERPKHRVKITPFSMSQFPVTQAQWVAIMGSNPSKLLGENRPVEQVRWKEAVGFCQKLSKKNGKEYRLPTEAEWEYACRAGTTTPFYFGKTITTDLANYYGNDTYGSGPKGKNREQTTEVGSFPPNAFGLYDMHGNIWEWCQDAWHESYKGAPTDGSAWENSDESRIFRGGSWVYEPGFCRSAYRFFYSPGFHHYNIGLRVVCSAPSPLQ